MLRPFFTYFGGKWRVAKHYPTPTHSTIVEPFAGSAGYSLRYPEKDVLLVDKDEAVAGTWDYLIRASEEEIGSLPLYDGTWETVDDLSYLPQEARWLIGWWLNKGTTRPSKSPSKWIRDLPSPGENAWGEGVRNRIVRQVSAIRHWEVRCGDYRDIENHESTWFVDPPYQVAGKDYAQSKVDYEHLAEWSKSRSGQVIVCENLGAGWMEFHQFRDIKATKGTSREVVWVKEA